MILIVAVLGCTQTEKTRTPTLMLEPIDVVAQGYGGVRELGGWKAVALSADASRAWAYAEDYDRLVVISRDGQWQLNYETEGLEIEQLRYSSQYNRLFGLSADRLIFWDVSGESPQKHSEEWIGGTGLALYQAQGVEYMAVLSQGALHWFVHEEEGLSALSSIEDPQLAQAKEMVVSPQGDIYVAGFDSSGIHHFGWNGSALEHRSEISDYPGLDRVDSLALHQDGTLFAGGYCDHQIAALRKEEGELRWIASSPSSPYPGCPPQVESDIEELPFVHPSQIVVLGDRIAVLSMSPLVDIRWFRWEQETLIEDGVLEEQPDWLDYSRLQNGFSEEGDLPPMVSNPVSWRGSYDMSSAQGHIVASSYMSDVLTWISPSGEVSFLHKGTGGADDLPGAYNIEADPGGQFVYVAPRNSVGVSVGSMRVEEDGSLGVIPFSLIPSEQWGAGALVNVYVARDGKHVYGVDADFGGVHSFSKAEDGSLERVQVDYLPMCGDEPPMPVDIITSYDGTQLYIADFHWRGPSCVHRLPLDAQGIPTGEIETLADEGLGGVEALFPTADGKEVLAACHVAQAVTRLQRAENEQLSILEVVSLPELDGAEFVTLSADNRWVYASSPVQNSLVVFSRADNGELQHVQTLQHQEDQPMLDAAGIAVTPDGSHVLLAARLSNSLLLFQKQEDGSLKLNDYEANRAGMTWINGVALAREGSIVVTSAVDDSAVATFRLVEKNP